MILFNTILQHSRQIMLLGAIAIGLGLPLVSWAQSRGKANVTFSATPSVVTAENAYLRIEFARKDGGIRLAKLLNKSDNRIILEDVGPLWRVETPKGVFSGDMPAKTMSLSAMQLPGGGARLSLFWQACAIQGVDTLDVEMTVDVAPNSPETRWQIHPVIKKGEALIQKVHFPVLDGIGRGGRWDRLIRPTDGEQWLLNPEIQRERTLLYPTGGYPALAYMMQFVIYEFAAPGCTERQADDQAQCAGGLYLAAYDPLGQLKQFSSKGLGTNNGTSLAIRHFGAGLVTEKNGQPGLGFPCVVGVFDGGYWEALNLYRNWARSQQWCTVGPIRKRKDFSNKFLNTHLWDPISFGIAREEPPLTPADLLKPGYLYQDFTDAEKATLLPNALATGERYFKTYSPRVGLQWYRWHTPPFDFAYPDYFPVRPGWLAAREQLERAHPGFFTHMPYINGRSVTNFSELWKTDKADVEKYSTGGKERYGVADFNVMCPDTEYWQNIMVALAKRIFQETKCDGLYIDQLGAPPVLCPKGDHGHVANSPASTAEGYQTMLRKIRAQVQPINPDTFLTQEFFSEHNVGLCDGFLTWMSHDVSLIAYVYGEYAILIGHAHEGTSPTDCAAEARCFLSGCPLGWSYCEDGNVMPYRAKLARFRAKALPYLLLPMARPLTTAPSLRILSTSLRKGDKGEAIVIATNPNYPTYGQPPLTMKEMYHVDCRAVGLRPGKFHLKAIMDTEEKDLGVVEVKGLVAQFEIALAEQESAIYVLEPLRVVK